MGRFQLQNRFEDLTKRTMIERDYAAWVAMRAIGEAATRTSSADPATLLHYMLSPDFIMGAFKGVGVSFRPWDGQMRQPILLASARQLVSVSPQQGFLHPDTDLDSLGPDQTETTCKLRR